MKSPDYQSPSKKTQIQPENSTLKAPSLNQNESVPPWKTHVDFILTKMGEKALYDEFLSQIEHSSLKLEVIPEQEQDPKPLTIQQKIESARSMVAMYKKLPSYEKLNLQLTALKLKNGKIAPENMDVTAVSQFLCDLPDLSFLTQAKN